MYSEDGACPETLYVKMIYWVLLTYTHTHIYIYIYIYSYMYRLAYERRGDISFIARETISYFVASERSERGTKYEIVSRAIKLISPRLSYANLFITYLCLYLEQKSDYIFKLFILWVHFGMKAKLLFKIR